jgi:xanthine dehydrogenase small subunit
MQHQPLHFIHRGRTVTLPQVPPDRTLLDLLREDMALTGTKEGCGSGDCGACTVVLADRVPTASGDGHRVQYKAVNSCIRLAHSIQGMALWTVQDLTTDPLLHTQPAGSLHPAQQAMVDCHGAQCGFCTPGVVMSLFGLYQQQVCQGRSVCRVQAQEALSGNLCRCTGYRPIVDAALRMQALPQAQLDEAQLLLLLEQENLDLLRHSANLTQKTTYMAPNSLPALLQARADHPQAQVVAGCTDVGLWVTQQHRALPQVLDVTRVPQLQAVVWQPDHLHIGAAATLQDAWAALAQVWPTLQHFAARFAGLPVRQAGTMGGNVVNGSPIGDSMPVLLALGAVLVVGSVRGQRRVPLEQFYTGYRQNTLAADELLLHVEVPLPAKPPEASTLVQAYKISKRTEDDISAVCLAVSLTLQQGIVTDVRIGVGGVAATPVRASQTEAALQDQTWNASTVAHAATVLQNEFTPLSDLRASSDYRRTVLAHLLQRLWLQSQGLPADVHSLDDTAGEAQP